MSDRSEPQSSQRGPNTHWFRDYRGTNYTLVNTFDVEGTTHLWEMPLEVYDAVAAQARADSERTVARLKEALEAASRRYHNNSNHGKVWRECLVDVCESDHAALANLSAPAPDERSQLNERHVQPNDDTHQSSPNCWCQPKVTYTDPLSGGRVYVHKKES